MSPTQEIHRMKKLLTSFLLVWGFGTASLSAQIALVSHAPAVNGTINGSVQQMNGESVTLNSGANITGDLQVPGTPTVQLNGTPTYSGV